MPSIIRTLEINPGSDGDGRKWPKHGYIRNDDYYKERIATNHWAKDIPGGPEPSVIYHLNKLPNGYAGFERVRPDGERTDYFLYGHPNGRFDSVKKFYPHFKHLMDYGGSQGCSCELCMAGNGNGKKCTTGAVTADSRNESERSTTPPQRARFFTAQKQDSNVPAPSLISPFQAKPRGRPPKHGRPQQKPPERDKRRPVDSEGTLDIYDSMVAKLKEAESGDVVDMPIEEQMSPDWRSGNTLSKHLFKEWQLMPRYVPRIGEIVLFVRKLNAGETIAWNASTQTFRRMNQASKEWLEQPKWEAGVVTQMPQEAVLNQDLVTDEDKEQSVIYSGFRVEPLSEPGKDHKPYTKQHKHVPLHLIRPLVYWQECLQGVAERDCHPSIWHALTVMSSFCVVGRYRFKGIWPNATIFCRGVYIGSELITVGDVVRLLPRHRKQRGDAVTDVMAVTAIRLRFVNLDLEEDDMSPVPVLPYQTCLHISGRVYTLDPSRSFDGVGKVPIDPKSDTLPAGLSESAPWYHYSDPRKSAARIEVPYTRILGRCFEDSAINAWFRLQLDVLPLSSAKPVNTEPIIVKEGETEISRGLRGLADARQYSQKNDKRIKSEEGKTWFWADTRIEQLDLHELNGWYVGVKHERTQEDLRKWRTTLKALDGKKGALEEYHAARKAREAEKVKKENSQLSSSAYGMVAASRQAGTESPSATDAEKIEEGEAMDLDEEPEDAQISSDGEEDDASGPERIAQKEIEVITLSGSEAEDERATDQLAGELAKNIRANDPRLR